MSTVHAASAARSPAMSLAEYRVTIDALDREIVSLAARMNADEYRLLVMIREFDERGGFLKWGLSSCAEWLHFRCDMSLSTAREKVRVAHALKDLAETSAAFGSGRLSYSKVRALTRVATAANEAALVDFALATTAARVEERCRQMRNVEPGSVDDALRAHRRRGLSVWRDDANGTLRITVELPLEAGELVEKALDKAVMALPTHGPEFAGTSWHAQRADALVDIARTYLAPRMRGDDRSGDDGRGGDSRRDAGRGDVGRGDTAGGRAAARSAGSAADHYQVVVHVDRSALTDGTGRSDLPIETVKRLTCDGSLIAMLDGADGEPLSVGRKRRTVGTAIRRALWARDKGCTFPGCTHTRFVDAHHFEHWADGGETSADNTMLLCTAHHYLVHEGGYTIHEDRDGRWYFRRPDGRAVPGYGDCIDDVTDESVRGGLAGRDGHAPDASVGLGDAVGCSDAAYGDVGCGNVGRYDVGDSDVGCEHACNPSADPSADASVHHRCAVDAGGHVGIDDGRVGPCADASARHRYTDDCADHEASGSPSADASAHRRRASKVRETRGLYLSSVAGACHAHDSDAGSGPVDAVALPRLRKDGIGSTGWLGWSSVATVQ